MSSTRGKGRGIIPQNVISQYGVKPLLGSFWKHGMLLLLLLFLPFGSCFSSLSNRPSSSPISNLMRISKLISNEKSSHSHSLSLSSSSSLLLLPPKHSTMPTTRTSYYMSSSSETNNNSDDDGRSSSTSLGQGNETTSTTTTGMMIEGFGVSEKTMEFRDLIGSANEVDVTVPEEDLIEPPPSLNNVVGIDDSSSLSSSTTTKKTTGMVDQQKKTKTKMKKRSTPTLEPLSILRFVAPTLALWIAPPVMSLIDTSVVGRYCGPTDLAALNPGCTLIDSSAYLFMFIATAATNMVATARANENSNNGEQQQQQGGGGVSTTTTSDGTSERIVGEALFLALISGIFLASVVLVAGQPLLLAIAGQESASVVPSALKYATVRAYGQPFVVMASVARAAALARKDTRGPLLSVALAFGLNAVGTMVLVRTTNLGIVGAAIGTLVADVVATIFLLDRMRRQQQPTITPTSTEMINGSSLGNNHAPISTTRTPLFVIPTKENFRRFRQYAAPIFFTILGKSVVYNGVAMSVGRLGSVALAAHQVLLRSFFFWTPVGDSVGMTSQVFLPGILAEERRTGIPKHGAKRLLFGIGTVAGLAAATLAGLLPSKGAGLFTTDLQVAAALKETSPILALSVAMHAVALTCEGMLLAQRDLGFLSSSYVITTILTAALLLSPFRPGTLGGSWWILALFQGGRALQFALRTLWISRGKGVQQSVKEA